MKSVQARVCRDILNSTIGTPGDTCRGIVPFRRGRSGPEKKRSVFCFLFALPLCCPAVGVRACVVSFAGDRGVRHSVEVTAETLYEAAALALSIFRQSE
jgi:hypothetical protein